MKCPRCRIPVEIDESQCSVCGEILRFNKKNESEMEEETAPPPPAVELEEEHGLKFEVTPSLARIGIIWMICCVVFAVVAILVALQQSSVEAMWASFLAAALAALPVIYVILGRSVEVAYWFRKELTILCAIMGGIVCVYLLSQGIMKSQIQVETSGMQEMVTNENFTKTLITAIICISLVIVLIPMARMLMKSSAIKTFTNRYEIDSQQDMHTRTSENTTSLELKRLELAHQVEMQKLELERQRIQIEADRMYLLNTDQQLLLTARTQTDITPNVPPPPPPPPASGINL